MTHPETPTRLTPVRRFIDKIAETPVKQEVETPLPETVGRVVVSRKRNPIGRFVSRETTAWDDDETFFIPRETPALTQDDIDANRRAHYQRLRQEKYIAEREHVIRYGRTMTVRQALALTAVVLVLGAVAIGLVTVGWKGTLALAVLALFGGAWLRGQLRRLWRGGGGYHY